MFITSIHSISRCSTPLRQSSPVLPTTHHSRFFHIDTRTPFPDLELAKTFKQRYVATEEGDWTLGMIPNYPNTLTRYWRVAQTMQQKGLIPFVHGQTVVWSIPQRILKALDYRGSQLLRFSDLDTLETNSEIVSRIDSLQKKRNAKKEAYPRLSKWAPFIFQDSPLDHTPELRKCLLAVTIGLFHLERKESPFSFVFGGCYGSPPHVYQVEGNRNVLPLEECKKIARTLVAKALENKGYNPEVSNRLLQQIEPLYEEAARLSIGQFLVCGVPYDNLPTHVYHSQPLGDPTGLSVNQVLKDLSLGLTDRGCQARLLLSRETMRADNRIEVINIMDETEVQSFCKSFEDDFLPPEQEEGLNCVLTHKNTETEDKLIAQIDSLYKKIDQVIQAVLLNEKKGPGKE